MYLYNIHTYIVSEKQDPSRDEVRGRFLAFCREMYTYIQYIYLCTLWRGAGRIRKAIDAYE
jgi:hypothetical protein